jgi:hypothetical protein
MRTFSAQQIFTPAICASLGTKCGIFMLKMNGCRSVGKKEIVHAENRGRENLVRTIKEFVEAFQA